MFKSLLKFLSYTSDNLATLRAWGDDMIIRHIPMSPTSPSLQDRGHYKRQLDKIRNGQILVLGVTPQLRNSLVNFKGKILVADFSKAMYHSVGFRVNPTVLAKEDFIWTNWLNLDKILKAGVLDVIVGDLVFMQIGPKARERFTDVLYRIIKPSGLLVIREKFFNPLWRNAEVLDMVRKGLIYSPEQGHQLNPFLLYRLGDKILDLESFSFRSKDFTPFLREALNKTGNFSEKVFINNCISYYESIDMPRSLFTKSAFESLLAGKFEILDIKRSQDYEEAEFFPIYVLRRI